MKLVFVGGGSAYILPLVRALLHQDGVMDGGEIHLMDLNLESAKAVATMAQKSPEYATSDCRIGYGDNLEAALPGADAVAVILMGGSQESHARGMVASLEAGFIASDNLSLNGSFLGVKASGIIRNVAEKMEVHCPEAILMDFANPEAILSGMIANHSPIKAMGICAGATNHQWDLARVFGEDIQSTEFEVETAGVNHLSFIRRGSRKGIELFSLLDERLRQGYREPVMQDHYAEDERARLLHGIQKWVEIYQKYDALIFSTEGDGMHHLTFDDYLESSADQQARFAAMSMEEKIKANMRITPQRRQELETSFNRLLNQDLDQTFWDEQAKQDYRFARNDNHVICGIMRGLSGVEKTRVVVSRPNNGAVKGLPDQLILEYSHNILGKDITAAGQYDLPESVFGITAALAMHQTMVAAAIMEEDPKKLAQAFLSYPVRAYSKDLRNLCRQLVEINCREMPVALRAVTEFL
jgi:alpha-galactosidase/6-phospho-beta-glucosidase family protein